MDKEYKLYLSYSQTAHGGKPYEGETGPYASHEPIYQETQFHRLYINQPAHMMFFDIIDISENEFIHFSKKKHLYLSVIFYSDGDSFGATYGHYQISGVSSTKKGAERLNKNALEGDEYKPWVGYFSHLMSNEVFLLDLVK